MEAWLQILIGTVGGCVFIWIGYYWGKGVSESRLLPLIEELEEEIHAEVKEAPKFRVRTAEADPRRRARSRKARLRAIKYTTPPPRR